MPIPAPVAAKLRLIYAQIALSLILLALFEIAGQISYYAVKGHWVFEKDQYLLSRSGQPFELHPFLAARPRANARIQEKGFVLTTTSNHTRWTGARHDRSDAVRVAVLGGSTTFGSGVTDTDSWPARLQTLLGPGYAVTNYGVPGYSTAESVIQMALIVPEIRPDIVVVYHGWNDIHNYHDRDLGVDYYRHGVRQYSNLSVQRPLPRGLFAKLADVSAVVNAARAIGRRLPSFGPGESSDPAYPTPDDVGNPNPDPLVDRMYMRNLLTLKVLATHMGADVVFVPQVMNYSKFKGKGGNWWTPHVQNAAMPYLFERFNRMVNDVCRPDEPGCAVLTDVRRWKWQREDFIDEGHFSPEGTASWARRLAGHITRLRHSSDVDNCRRSAMGCRRNDAAAAGAFRNDS